MASNTRVRIDVNGKTIEDVVELDYSSDMMAVGDEAHFTIVNRDGQYTGDLPIGALLEPSLSNPDVTGPKSSLQHRSSSSTTDAAGRGWTLKHRGRVTDRVAEVDPSSGSTIKITSADLGWHLANCCAPLWFNLRQGALADLIDPTRSRPGRAGQPVHFIDPSFGLKGYRGTNKVNRALKQSVKVAEALANQELKLFAIQVEPGDMHLDKIIEHARRANLLINVSVDGRIQAWLPDYTEPPQFKVVNRKGACNILRGRKVETARTAYTEVECVGEQFAYEAHGGVDATNPNATKKRGKVVSANLPANLRSPLPFLHRLTFVDSEMYSKGLAQKMAEWKYKRSLFESFYVEYTFAEHHQDGLWWESDYMISVDDDDLGLSGNFYIQSVNCTTTKTDGDLTRVVIRWPGLLTAGLEHYPGPPKNKSKPQPSPGAGA